MLRPEIPINIVDLGLIYDIDIDGDHVDVTIILSAVGCPLADQMKDPAEQVVQSPDGVEPIECEIDFEIPFARTWLQANYHR